MNGSGGEGIEGRVLGGHYLVGERIGAGAMGVVHRVRHTLLGREFAAKVLAPSLAGDPEARRRFLHEAEALARISHPNVVAVRHFGEEDGLLYLIMDLCEGENLRALLLREGPLPVARAIGIALQVLLALDAAHWEGVVHRDLKPANILVAPPDPDRGGPERVRVVDFGLARVAGTVALPGGKTSAPGTVAGTVAYMSPEQVGGDREVDARSDLFCLGAVLHEMLGGQPPFDGPSTLAVAMAILEKPPPLLPEHGPRGVPAPVRAVLLRALEKDQASRYQSAAEMAEALRDALANGSPAPALAPPSSNRGRFIVAAATAGLLALAAYGTTRFPAPVPETYDAARAGADRDLALRSFLDSRFEAAEAAAGRVVDSGMGTAEDLLLLGRARVGLESPSALPVLDRAETLLGTDPRPAMERARLRSLGEVRDLDAALVDLDRILARGPNPDALYRRAWVLHQLATELAERGLPGAQEREGVLRRLEADALALSPDPRGAVAGALAAWHRGEFDRARERARFAADGDPDLAEAAFVSGWICFARCRPYLRPADAEQSRRWYEQGIAEISDAIARARRRPEYFLQGRELLRFWRVCCDVKRAMGDGEAAAADFLNEIIGRNPSLPGDLRNGAMFLQWGGRFPEALSAYEAYRRGGNPQPVFHGKGYCHMQIGRRLAEAGDLPGALRELEEAVANYTAGAKAFPGDAVYTAYRAEAWLTRARILRDEASADCLAKARLDFETLDAEGKTALPEVLFRRWEYHEALGDHAAALTDIRAAIAANKDDSAAHHRRLAFSCIANASGPGAASLLDEAVAAAEEAERWNPRRAELSWILMGDAHAALAGLQADPSARARGFAAAGADYARADSLAPLDPRVRAEARLRAAGARLAAGDAPGAVREAEEAMRLRTASDPSVGSFLFVNDYYLRSPLSAFHRRLSESYAAANRPADAAREDSLARALR